MDSTIDRLNAAPEGRYTLERELGAGGMATVYRPKSKTRLGLVSGGQLREVSVEDLVAQTGPSSKTDSLS